MKKTLICLVIMALSLALIPIQLNATEKEKTLISAPAPIRTEESKALELRISEINAMDKSNLSVSEKKELRKEVKNANKKAKNYQHDGIVFIGGGSLLLIIILILIFV